MYGENRVTMKRLYRAIIPLLFLTASSIVATVQTKAQQPKTAAAKPATTQPTPVTSRIGTDMQDLENAMNFLGITAFKFPLVAGAGKAYAVNFIVEEYENGAQKQRINLASLLTSQMREGG